MTAGRLSDRDFAETTGHSAAQVSNISRRKDNRRWVWVVLGAASVVGLVSVLVTALVG